MSFLDTVSVLFIRATYFAKTDYPGMWLLPWHLMSASMDILFKGLPSIPFSSCLTSRLLSPSHPASPSTLPPVCHAVTFSQRAHTDLVHRQSCQFEVCVCVRGCMCHSSFLKLTFLQSNQTRSKSARANRGTLLTILLGSNFYNSRVSMYCVYHVYIIQSPACRGSPRGLSFCVPCRKC